MTGSGPGDEPTDPGHDDGDDRRADAPDSSGGPSDSRENVRSDRPAVADDARTEPRETAPSRDEWRRATDGSGQRPGAASGGADDADRVTIEDDGYLRWFIRSDEGTAVAVRDVLTSVAIVAALGLLLFGISGIWPPLVAVESGSMEPNMERGDLIFVVDENRFVGDEPVGDTGIVTREAGMDGGDGRFGGAGDVIIFQPDGSPHATPVIHRAHFWVEEGEDWVDTKAEEEYLNGNGCEDLQSCPANRDGFVTKGDANGGYDQAGVGANTNVVSPEWINGKGLFRIPWLGYIRLTFDSLLFAGPAAGAVTAAGVSAGTLAAAAVARGRPRSAS